MSFPVLKQIEPQTPLLVVPAKTSSVTGTALIAVVWSFDPILSASDGTGEEREDTRKQREERMDKEATSVDIDAIDADMPARAGELIPWLLVQDGAPRLSFCARHRGRDAVTLVACHRK